MTLLVPAEIEAYALKHTSSPDPLLGDLEAECRSRFPTSGMLSGPTVGYFLNTLVHVSRARRVLEIGTFVGYSALMMASALPENGELITCDVDPEATAIARRYWEKHPAGKRISLKLGAAAQTLDDLRGEFDIVFIDADKESYSIYYEKALSLLSERGAIVVDNVLWSGNVLDPKDESARAIASLNDYVTADPRVQHVMLTVRDGLMLIRRA